MTEPEVITREGMECMGWSEPVTLVFTRRVLEPHLWYVTCSGCGSAWRTPENPSEFMTLKEARG